MSKVNFTRIFIIHLDELTEKKDISKRHGIKAANEPDDELIVDKINALRTINLERHKRDAKTREKQKDDTDYTQEKGNIFYFVCLQHSYNERMNERTHTPGRPYRFIRYTLFNHLSTSTIMSGIIRHEIVATSDSCNSGHSENYEEILTFSYKSLKFSTKWYTKLCILVDPFLQSQIFDIYFKKAQKKALHLKG